MKQLLNRTFDRIDFFLSVLKNFNAHIMHNIKKYLLIEYNICKTNNT